MKLKMAPNSLFAVLLRSPWWVSIAIVAAIALASRALLPSQYVVFGVMGGFPFLVIGIVAAMRQWQAPSPARVNEILTKAAAMPWRDFSQAMELAYRQQGYAVSRLTEGAADLVLTKDGRTTLLACKRWKAANHGAEPLRSLAAATQQRDASNAIYVSLLEPDSGTSKAAAAQKIQLLSGAALAGLLARIVEFR